MFLHVIARSEATWQSASPAAAHSGELRLRRIRKASRIRPNCCHLARFLCGENGLPRQCAHWLAMTCRRQRRVSGCKNVGRNDMQKAETCLRVQGRFPAVHRQCPGIVRTGGKFLHVIARSEATWQSASPAAAHSGELRLRRIRKASRIRPNCCHLARFLCGENGLPRQCAHWLAMTC